MVPLIWQQGALCYSNNRIHFSAASSFISEIWEPLPERLLSCTRPSLASGILFISRMTFMDTSKISGKLIWRRASVQRWSSYFWNGCVGKRYVSCQSQSKKRLTGTGISTGQQASALVGMARSSRWRETPLAIPVQQIGIVCCSGYP